MEATFAPQIVGRYGIYGKIASGGMASVHFGRLLGAVGFSRTVAIKRLHPHLAEDPEFLSTMIDEARLAARIHHPNVVPTLDVVAADGELLIVMEYIRGESLARLLRNEIGRGGSVPLPVASAIVIGALQGLHAAHVATSDRGTPLHIVHRDVSPQNILVAVDGLPRVIDFGVAKAVGRLQTTNEGVLKGKIAYMAPEQLSGGEITPAVDIYGMGVVLWEVLAGRRLFPGEHAAVYGQVRDGAKEPPSRIAPHIPPQVDALVMKALAVDPRRRFASAMEMAEALLRLVPPVFSTAVGAWVEDVAADALTQRGAKLAEIERSSGAFTAPRQAAAESAGSSQNLRALRAAEIREEPITTASQPSSLAVATPRFAVANLRSGKWAGLAGASVLLVALLTVLAWRGHRASTETPPILAVPASAPPVTSPASSSATEATDEPPALELPATPIPSPAASTSERPRSTSTPPPNHPTRTPKAMCDPPYTFDANGIKRYKRECN
jgi:hypothetical protein